MPTTPSSEELVNRIGLPEQPLHVSCQGFQLTRLHLDPPGDESGYSWVLQHRCPSARGFAASSWSAPLASGAIAGASANTISIVGDAGELRLTLSDAVGEPAVRVLAYRSA